MLQRKPQFLANLASHQKQPGHSANVVSAAILSVILCAPIVCPKSATAAAATATKAFRDIKMTALPDAAAQAKGELRADAKEVADILKITPYVEKIRAEKSQGANSSSASKPLQQARLLCLWKLLQADEEVRREVASIHFDLAATNSSLGALSARRQRLINNINTFNFMQGGSFGVIKQSLSLHHVRSDYTQTIGMTSFGTSTAMGLSNLLLSSYVIKSDLAAPPDSLSKIASSSYQPADANRSYLWQFLEAKYPGTELKRRQVLVKHWQDFAALSAKEEAKFRVPSGSAEVENLTEAINTTNRRIALLHDLQTHIEEFDGSLFELHQAITLN